MPASRPTLSLEGLWEFSFDGPAATLGEGWRPCHVPGIWQTQFPELRNAQGLGRYRRDVELPADWAGKRVVLIMEGVFHEATILIDDLPVANHPDGWTTIEVDLTDPLDGAMQFALGVEARAPDDRDYARSSFATTLAGKQDWYGVHGGVWKPCRLEAREAEHFATIAFDARTTLSAHSLAVSGRHTAPDAAIVRVTVSKDGRAIAARDFATGGEFSVRLAIDDVDLWSPEAPNLYRVEASLIVGVAVKDSVARDVGFRLFEARDGKLVLNGKPFFMFGALDQDWHSQEDCRFKDASALERRFLNAKALGLNTLRCHVKIPDKLYFELADRLGLVVWLDMPYAQFLAPATREAVKRVFAGVIATHGHHPSIAILTLFNEGWGIDLDDNPDDRRWLVETFDWAKSLAEGRLVVDNSPCFPRNYHLKTDIEDFHWYAGFPLSNAFFEQTTSAFAARAAFPWSPHGDAVKRGDEPLICSEFGVWGLPHVNDIRDAQGREPWWFESGHDWNEGAAYPHGVESRFRDMQLAPIFGDLDAFVDAAQEHQYRALKFQIETLRWAAPLSGYVITELNDVQWESNGLMDVENNLRRFADRLANLQRPFLIIARADRTAIAAGEIFEVKVRLAGAAPAPQGATLRWRFGAEEGLGPIGPEPATLTLSAPATESIRVQTLALEARDAGGALLSENVVEFCVAPPLSATTPALYPMDDGALEILACLNWPNSAASRENADALLATSLTTPLREALISGRKALLVANRPDALIDVKRKLPLSDRHNFPNLELRAREGTPWDGRWMGAFAWRRIDGPWAYLPNGPMLDEHFSGLIPRHVLTGFLSPAFGGLVDAGLCVGWLHKAAAFAKRSFLGRGWMTVSTFDLTSDDGLKNPLAAHLLLALAKS